MRGVKRLATHKAWPIRNGDTERTRTNLHEKFTPSSKWQQERKLGSQKGIQEFLVRWAVHAFIGSLNTTTATATAMVTRTSKKSNRFHSGTTTTLHVYHTFWYISLVFSARLGRDIKDMLGSLRCDDGDGNENVKKATRLN